MTLFLIILGLFFLVLTGVVLTKAQNVLNAAKKVNDTDTEVAVDSANNFNGIMLLVFWVVCMVATTWSFLVYRKDFLPEASSPQGRETDYWFWLSMIVITIAFVIVNSVLFYFSAKYRYNKNRKATYYPHNNKLEVIWTVIPAIIMAGLVLTGLDVWNRVTADAPKDAEVIEIMGKQFNWLIRYSGQDGQLGDFNYKMTNEVNNESGVDFTDPKAFDDFTSGNTMYIPKGQPVKFQIRARDVLHSVFVPHMRMKMDAVPGMPTSFWFNADKSTAEMQELLGNPDFKYEIACTEICGRGHFSMKINLVVLEKAEYEVWKKEQKTYLTMAPELLDLVPAALKAKAMKYIQTAPTATSDSTAVAGL